MRILHTIVASAALIAAAPASAVTLTSVSAPGGNTVTPVETTADQVSVDFGVSSLAPITLGFTVDQGDAGSYFFDSYFDVLTGINPAVASGLTSLTLSLTNGATFSVGNLGAAFSNATASLNGAGDVLSIYFTPRETAGLELGNVFGGTTGDFAINRNGIADGGSFGLTVQAAVPEPATWLTLILGFGVLGAALRRRPAISAHA